MRGAGRAKCRELPIEFRERAVQLRSSRLVARVRELTAQFFVREPERFGAPQLFGILLRMRYGTTRALFLALVHPLLNPVLCVDETFTCICHRVIIVRLRDGHSVIF